jgi:predicted acetyltransferase
MAGQLGWVGGCDRRAHASGYRRWLWDGEFCGSIGFRWQRGTEALPPYCLGHIGYAVVPWKQRRGYATSALRELLREAKAEGLRYVEITTATENVASQRVIENNEGVFVEEFVAPESLGAGESGGTVSIS